MVRDYTRSTPIKTHDKHTRTIGLLMLFMSFVLSCYMIHLGDFIDEADTLVAADQMRLGHVLYRDVFSHHLPFPVYWSAFFISVFGKSILVARLSVLVFQTLLFLGVMHLSRAYVLTGFVALCWSIIKPYYLGHMVVYSAFSGVALASVFVLTFFALSDAIKTQQHTGAVIGVLAAVAVLSDPLCLYAVMVAMAFLLYQHRRTGAAAIGGYAAIVGVWFLFLWSTQSLGAFWKDVIIFNTDIYSQFKETHPLRINNIAVNAATLLHITDGHWFNIDPLRPVTRSYGDLDKWLFTGFLYRFAIIALTLLLAANKKYKQAIFVYLFAASALTIDQWEFRSQPFVLTALFCIAFIFSFRKSKYEKLARIVIAVAFFWLLFRLMFFLYAHRAEMNYIVSFSRHELDANNFKNLSCQQENVFLADYPSGAYRNWFTGMRPVSRYAYMWPWVAQVGLQDVINTLRDPNIKAIVTKKDFILWNKYDSKAYLKPLDDFLGDHYLQIVGQPIYISPALYAACYAPADKKP